MKLLIGLGYKLGFVLIFHFPVSRAGSSLPVPSFSNILQYDPFLKLTLEGYDNIFNKITQDLCARLS